MTIILAYSSGTMYNKLLDKKCVCLKQLGIQKFDTGDFDQICKKIPVNALDYVIDLGYDKLVKTQKIYKYCSLYIERNMSIHDGKYVVNVDKLKDSDTIFIDIYNDIYSDIIPYIKVFKKLILVLHNKVSPKTIFNCSNLSGGIIHKLDLSKLQEKYVIEDSHNCILKYKYSTVYENILNSSFIIKSLDSITVPNTKYILSDVVLDKIIDIPVHIKVLNYSINNLKRLKDIFPQMLSLCINGSNINLTKVKLSTTSVSIKADVINGLDVFLDKNTQITSLKIRKVCHPLYDFLKNNRSLTHIDVNNDDPRIDALCAEQFPIKSARKI